MPKISSFISPAEIGAQYTVVNSAAYGRHVRAKRGTHTPLVVTDTMKKAGELLRSANQYAKVITDAFKPFCEDIRDGQRWQRLVSIIRKQLQKDDIDLPALFKGFYFHRRRPLHGVLGYHVEVIQPEGAMNSGARESVTVKVSSKNVANPQGYHHPDQYEQIIIAVFLDKDFRATVLSDSKVHPISPDKDNEHVVTFSRPDGASRVIIAMKCNHLYRRKPCPGITNGMSVVKVVA